MKASANGHASDGISGNLDAMHYEPVPPAFRILYKPVEKCQHGGPSIDVMLPSSAVDVPHDGLAVVMWSVPWGGAFTVGASSDLAHHQVRWYLRNGFAVLSPEYRLAPHVSLKEIREDILESYLYVQRHLNSKLQELSGGKAPKLDTARCISSGGSAGGSSCLYLALEIFNFNAQKSECDRIPPLRAVMPAYPLTNPDGFNNEPRSTLEGRAHKECPEDWDVIKTMFDEDTSVDFKTNSMPLEGREPRTLFCMRASDFGCINSYLAGCDPPYGRECYITANITAEFPPTCVVIAPKDSAVPPEQSYELYAKLKAQGVVCEKIEGFEAEHGFTEWNPIHWPKNCNWWMETMLPSLKWAQRKALA